MRKCTKCNIPKDNSLFRIKTDRKSGYSSHCKECEKQNRILNKDKIKKYQIKYNLENKDKIDKIKKEYKLKNKDKISLKNKTYYIENKTYRNTYSKIYNKERRKIDPIFKLRGNIRALIFGTFKNNYITKKLKSETILGCTFIEFKEHLEKQFDNKMNWGNQGSYWEMDHIKPVSLAQTEQELLELNHYTNFQPLYWEDNLKKSNKLVKNMKK